MPTIETLYGTITVQPIQRDGKRTYNATFDPYPHTDTIDEEEDTEKQALDSVCSQLESMAVEAKNRCHEYLQKQVQIRKNLSSKARKGVPRSQS